MRPYFVLLTAQILQKHLHGGLPFPRAVTLEEKSNVNLRCLWQRAVLPIIAVTTERKEATPDAQ